jgi:acyl-coenzyme A thioesterase PaaI-like protein
VGRRTRRGTPQFIETEEGIEVPYRVAADLQGAPGVVHGGIQATLLDEAMCMAAYAKLGMPVVTGELTVRYLQSVPTQTDLLVRSRITETKEHSAFIEGVIYLAGSDTELTRARGRFFAQGAA